MDKNNLKSTREYVYNRTIEEAKYIIDTNATVRVAGKFFGISKSTIYKDMTERLPRINPTLAHGVNRILQANKEVKHINGGLATKLKYMSALKK